RRQRQMCIRDRPLLPSLLPKGARAGGFASPRRFVALRTGHGSCWDSLFFPEVPAQETMDYAGHAIRRSDLTPSTSGDETRLSSVLRAPSSAFSPTIAASMNVIRGVDSFVHVGHNTGAFLGNSNATDDTATQAVTTARPTIDQLLAWSPWFYDDLSTNLERSLHVGGGISYGWSSPQSQSGEVQRVGSINNPLTMFNLIFVPDDGNEPDPRPLIIDGVLEEYRSLREGNRRLSAADRQRLDDHIERIDELQRKLEVVVDCGSATPPELDSDIYPWAPGYYADLEKNRAYWQAFNEVVAVAFACDTSRIAVFSLGDQSSFSDYTGDWHQDIAHMSHLTEATGGDALPQTVLCDSYQRVFESVFLDLVGRLDIDDGQGNTILDSSLVVWGQESGAATHNCTNMPLVTAGSLGGAVQTGQNLDYRNLDSTFVNEFGGPSAPNGEAIVTGLTTNQFLGSIMQLMGVPPEDYETDGVGGYGEPNATVDRAPFYPSSVTSRMGEVLPWLGS
ncbi:MAG: DUF1552 domain-containing protein, partial [Nannocystaceae bacterium]|nr:DUF1552 domain-containing protein [Nannocystaceae bacterium]